MVQRSPPGSQAGYHLCCTRGSRFSLFFREAPELHCREQLRIWACKWVWKFLVEWIRVSTSGTLLWHLLSWGQPRAADVGPGVLRKSMLSEHECVCALPAGTWLLWTFTGRYLGATKSYYNRFCRSVSGSRTVYLNLEELPMSWTHKVCGGAGVCLET